jgi:transposase
VDVVRRIEQNDQEDESGLDEPHNSGNGRPTAADRLAVDGLAAVVEQYRAGVTARELAERYAVSLSTIKRMLRANGARRRSKPPS